MTKESGCRPARDAQDLERLLVTRQMGRIWQA
jgi:hypothetical protein